MAMLSVIIPVYNEADTIKNILEKIIPVPIDKEIIVVDDGSSDGTSKILGEVRYDNLKVIYHTSNRGKGAAFLTGLTNATGDFVIIQDADLEYDPYDYLRLLDAFRVNNVDFVLGARFKNGYQGLLLHKLGNRFLTFFLNLLFNSQLNDYATCYKLAPKSTFDSLKLTSCGFEIDVEMICGLLKGKKRVIEVPISYYPRSYSSGKKIRWDDGVKAIVSIIKYRFIK